MLKNLRTSLALCGLAFSILCSSGYALEGKTNSEIHHTSPRTSLLTKQQIIEGFNAGVTANATHMLIVWDTWDFENSYNFILYVYPGKDVNDLIKYYEAPGFYRVSAVLAMHLDLDQQLNDNRWHPEYP